MGGKRMFLFKIWKSFFILIIIPILLLNIAILFLINNIKQTTEDAFFSQMNQANFFLEQTLENSLSSVRKMGSNSTVLRLSEISPPFLPEEYGVIVSAGKAKLECGADSENSFSISLLFHRNNILLDPLSSCSNLNEFYGDIYNFGYGSVDEIKSAVLPKERATFLKAGEYLVNKTVMPGFIYLTKATAYTSLTRGITAIVLIHNKNLENIMGGFSDMGGMAYIMDKNGNIIYSIGDEVIKPKSFQIKEVFPTAVELSSDLLGKNNFVLYSTAVMDLQIVAAVPNDALFLKANNLSLLVFLLDITTFIMSLILSVMIARHNNKEVNLALALLPDIDCKKGSTTVFSYIREATGRLLSDNQSLKSQLEAQHSFLSAVFWGKVCGNEIVSEEELLRIGKSAGMVFDSKEYALVLIAMRKNGGEDLESFNEQQQQREILIEFLDEIPHIKGYVQKLGVEQVAILFKISIQSNYREQISQMLKVSFSLFKGEFAPICVGSYPFERLDMLTSAYSSCQGHLNTSLYYSIIPHEIFWSKAPSHFTQNNFFFGDDLKNQIICGIKSGQIDLVKSCFKKILDENFINYHISASMCQLLTAKLKLTLLDAYDDSMDIALTEAYKNIDDIQTEALLISYTLRLALNMCEHYSDRIHKRSNALREKISAFSDAHFHEYDFSLSSVASYCGFSESYLSQLFKEVIGENFSTYLERKRMELANELLHSDLTVEAIGEKIGYSNTNAFRKAFKKFYGVSPRQYK